MAAGDAEAALALVCGPSALAAIFRVSRQTVAEWRRAGMPACGPARYRLADVVRWRRARDQAAAAAAGGPLAQERRRLIREQARGHELANAARASSLLPREDVLHDVAEYQRIAADVLDRLPDCADAVAAAGDDPVAIRRVLSAAVRQARVDLAEAVQRYGDGLGGDDGG